MNVAGLRLAIACAVLAGCAIGPDPKGWTGPDLHVVGGYWVGRELPCPSEDAGWCAEAVRTATEAVTAVDPTAVVTEARLAQLPLAPEAVGGVLLDPPLAIDPTIVIVTLASGERLVLGLSCVRQSHVSSVRPAAGGRICSPAPQAIERYRVGNEPAS